jgi:hypothetical protein
MQTCKPSTQDVVGPASRRGSDDENGRDPGASNGELDHHVGLDPARCGTYRTLCGRAVLAAALTTPPGRRCATCHARESERTARHDVGLARAAASG